MIDNLRKGSRYPTYKAFEAALQKFSRETNSVYTIIHSRTVELENRGRPPSKHIPKYLKYKNIKFACKHYGKTRSNSQGLRPNQSSYKIGCPSFIYVSANLKELVVEKILKKHSHSCDPALVSLYPERRSLIHAKRESAEEVDDDGLGLRSIREDVLDAVAIGIDRRRILNYVWLSTGRELFAADLRNFVNSAKDHPRVVSDERASELMELLKTMENKEGGKMYKPQTKAAGLSSVKRKVPPPNVETIIKTEIINNDDSSDQCYTVTDEQEGEQAYDNTMYIDPLQLVSQDNIQNEEIHYQYENQDEQENAENAASWNENSSFADVVKSVLGPNQEGPVILHVNKYDGVTVVQFAEHQSYTTEVQELETAHGNPSTEAVTGEEETYVEPQPQPQPEPARLNVRKSLVPKKPVVVTAMSADAIKSTSAHNLLKSAQLTKSNPPEMQFQKTQSTQKLSDKDENSLAQDEGSSVRSEHRSVLEDERTMYRVKTKKIRLQIDSLKNSIEKQGLEKRKLELEIRLLRMQVDEKEAQLNQS